MTISMRVRFISADDRFHVDRERIPSSFCLWAKDLGEANLRRIAERASMIPYKRRARYGGYRQAVRHNTYDESGNSPHSKST